MPHRIIIVDDIFSDRDRLKLTIRDLYASCLKLEIKDAFYLVGLAPQESLERYKNRLKDRFNIDLHWLLSIEEFLDGLLEREYGGLDRQTRDLILAEISQDSIHANLTDRP